MAADDFFARQIAADRPDPGDFALETTPLSILIVPARLRLQRIRLLVNALAVFLRAARIVVIPPFAKSNVVEH